MSVDRTGLTGGTPAGSEKAPPADPTRVAAIRAAIDLADPKASAGFGDRARLELLSALENLRSQSRAVETSQISDLLLRAETAVGELDPHSLTPRRGLAGLFDSRKKRLARLRERFVASYGLLESLRSQVKEGVERLVRRIDALETQHAYTRRCVLEVDAYIAAADEALAPAPAAKTPDPRGRAGTVIQGPWSAIRGLTATPLTPEAAPLDVYAWRDAPPQTQDLAQVALSLAPEPKSRAADPRAELTTPPVEGAPESALAGRGALIERKARLAAVRDQAVRMLPQVRTVQNVDAGVVARFSPAEAALARWAHEWSELLGLDPANLSAARAKRLRPDVHALDIERQRALEKFAGLTDEIAESKLRRDAAEARLDGLVETVRKIRG